jgi:hypothetical protein
VTLQARFDFRFGSHGQRFLLAVGFSSPLPPTSAEAFGSGLFREDQLPTINAKAR